MAISRLCLRVKDKCTKWYRTRMVKTIIVQQTYNIIEREYSNDENYDKSSRKHREEMLSHFINMRNVMDYNRLILHKASEKTLSENTRNGYSRNCILATGNCSVATTAGME